MSQTETSGINISAKNSKNLEQIGKELKEARAGLSSGANFDACGEYKKIKPILEKSLPFIRLIPKFGKQVAEAIELMMGIADQFCPQ